MIKLLQSCNMLNLVIVLIAAFARCDSLERIVGGQNAQIKDFNYQVSIQLRGEHSCGGSIISSITIVTAAHCTNWSRPSDITVRAGCTSWATGGQLRQVIAIYQHPLFDKHVFLDYDLAIIKVDREFELTNDVGTGWGLTSAESPVSSDVLQEVDLPIYNKKTCIKFYENLRTEITPRMSCWGAEEGKAPCLGDSGGPVVVYNEKSVPFLAAIVSWGGGCGQKGYPSIYADVANEEIYDFIRKYGFDH